MTHIIWVILISGESNWSWHSPCRVFRWLLSIIVQASIIWILTRITWFQICHFTMPKQKGSSFPCPGKYLQLQSNSHHPQVILINHGLTLNCHKLRHLVHLVWRLLLELKMFQLKLPWNKVDFKYLSEEKMFSIFLGIHFEIIISDKMWNNSLWTIRCSRSCCRCELHNEKMQRQMQKWKCPNICMARWKESSKKYFYL